MNGVLKATVRTVPKGTIYRVVGGVALGSVIAALAIATLFRSYLGIIAGYALLPLLGASVAWVVVGIWRLRLVGYLPAQPNDDDFIPRALQPWIRFWLLTRFGLLGAMLALLLAAIAAAVVGWGASYAVEALVYVVMVRIFMDLAFGAAFNLGIIKSRRSAG